MNCLYFNFTLTDCMQRAVFLAEQSRFSTETAVNRPQAHAEDCHRQQTSRKRGFHEPLGPLYRRRTSEGIHHARLDVARSVSADFRPGGWFAFKRRPFFARPPPLTYYSARDFPYNNRALALRFTCLARHTTITRIVYNSSYRSHSPNADRGHMGSQCIHVQAHTYIHTYTYVYAHG